MQGRDTYIREDTICSPFTPPGQGAMSAIRISGPTALEICGKVLTPSTIEDYPPRELRLARIYDGEHLIDRLLVVRFPTPDSFTGEDVVELHIHGSPYIARTVIDLLVQYGAREALPGEFSFRAVLNGKMDLTQAEGLAELINSKTDARHKAAISHLTGGLKERIEELRSGLLSLLAALEVTFDHPGDVVEAESTKIEPGIESALCDIAQLTESFDRGRLVREGIRLGIFGRTNVGKSSLLNLMVGRERAIVTDEPGTTRDVIEAPVELFGMEVKFVDTAGLRKAPSPVEALGQEKTREEMETADIRLIVLDGSSELTNDDLEVLGSASAENSIIVLNKSDLPQVIDESEIARITPDVKLVRMSCKTGKGYDLLVETLKSLLLDTADAGSDIIITSSRQHRSLTEAATSLDDSLKAAGSKQPDEIVALDLKAAIESLQHITGGTIEDDLYETIFAEFCIGK